MSGQPAQVVHRLAASIVHFLGEQLRNDELSSDGKESLEVAIQCLETAYGISSSDAHLLPSRSLLEIFTEAVRHEDFKDAKQEASEYDKQEAERYKNEGNEQMKNEEYEEALKSYTKAIKLDANNPVYFCNRAAAYSKLNNHTFALEDCQRSIDIDPNYSKAYGRMGLAYASLNDHQRAIQLYEKAIELDPRNESYHNNLAIAKDKLKEQQESNPFGKMLGSGLDFDKFLNNPAIMNMAQQFISSPGASEMFGNLMGAFPGMGGLGGMGGSAPAASGGSAPGEGNGAGGPDLSDFLRAGQQFAEQVQQNNPELLENIRRSFTQMDKKDEDDKGL